MMPTVSSKDAADYTLESFHLKKGKKFKYEYDFGAAWIFNCTVLRVLDESTKGWEIVRSVGENPEQYPSYDDEW